MVHQLKGGGLVVPTHLAFGRAASPAKPKPDCCTLTCFGSEKCGLAGVDTSTTPYERIKLLDCCEV